jgi:hypothetical protein
MLNSLGGLDHGLRTGRLVVVVITVGLDVPLDVLSALTGPATTASSTAAAASDMSVPIFFIGLFS